MKYYLISYTLRLPGNIHPNFKSDVTDKEPAEWYLDKLYSMSNQVEVVLINVLELTKAQFDAAKLLSRA